MRIVVTSDSHRQGRRLMQVFEKHMDDADLFINLGDGENDVDNVIALYPKIKLERVAGNCDWGSTLPLYKTITFDNKKILFTHGHPFYVKHGYEVIQAKAKAEGVDICLFGHTHTPLCEYKDGIYYMNPGAVCDNSYGIIDIEKNGIMTFNVKID